MTTKINLIYAIAAFQERAVSFPKAVEIANHFSEGDLQRIYAKIVFGEY